jgi:xanthine/CO dehydrogenase XdhC/CoxF family maturation factor
MTKKILREGLNISEEQLKHIDMPMGIDIGAESPEEIALSILCKLVAVKNHVEIKTVLHV